MTNLARLTTTLQALFTDTASTRARQDGFIQRQRRLTGAVFVQTLVFTWLANPQATLAQLAQTAAALGCAVSPQALAARFGPEAARLLAGLLATATEQLMRGRGVSVALLERFAGVYVIDTSSVALPAGLRRAWPGLGGSTPAAGAAAVKLELELDLRTGHLAGPALMSARRHDQRGRLATTAVARRPRGALHLGDLGYFSLDRFQAIGAAAQFWLSRLKGGTTLYAANGDRLDLDRALAQAARAGQQRLERAILLGARHRLPSRLLAERVPESVAQARRRRLRRAAQKHGRQPAQQRLRRCAWTLVVTNCASAQLAFDEVWVLARARWQIELLFKRWKQHGGVAQSRSRKPWRVLCELYAKLLAMLISHWIVLVGLWHRVEKSLVQGARVVAAHALALGLALRSRAQLQRRLTLVVTVLEAGCRLNRRRRHPNTYQRLLEPSICALT